MRIAEFQAWFNPRLEEYVRARLARYGEFTENADLLGFLGQVEQLLLTGKRVRPYLIDLSFRASGGAGREESWPLLLAAELFHTFCLIHDDIIDEDNLRRGVATVEAVAADKYAAGDKAHKAKRLGAAQAILVGDLVLSWVFEVLGEANYGAGVRAEFIKMIDEVVTGQMIDVDLLTRNIGSMAEIEQKMRQKTAGYTFVRPLRLGRLLAGNVGASAEVDELAESLGLAFQAQDDLFDVYLEEAEFGKNIASDLEEGQHTFLTQFVFDSGAPEQVALLNGLMGRELATDDVLRARQCFEETGAKKYVEDKIAAWLKRANDMAATLEWPENEKEELRGLISYVEKRKS